VINVTTLLDIHSTIVRIEALRSLKLSPQILMRKAKAPVDIGQDYALPGHSTVV
jgi:hypothetical protein